MRPSQARWMITALVGATPRAALAQGGHFGEGASPAFFVALFFGATSMISAAIAASLWVARPPHTPASRLLKPALGGVLVALSLSVISAWAMLALDAGWPGPLVILGGAAIYVALVRRRWRRAR